MSTFEYQAAGTFIRLIIPSNPESLGFDYWHEISYKIACRINQFQ
jgi:hypothetical protein